MPAIGHSVKFQLGAFFASGLLDANGKSMVELLPKVLNSGREVVPSVIQEVNSASLSGTAEVRSRIRLQSPETGLLIDYGAGRIDVQMLATAQARTVGVDLDAFCQEAASILDLLWPTDSLANRFTLVTDVMSVAVEEADFRRVLSALVVLDNRYTPESTNLWELRLSAKHPANIAGREEQINHISKSWRAAGELSDRQGTERFDRVFLQTDVNTSELATEPRFTSSQVADFAGVALEITKELQRERMTVL